MACPPPKAGDLVCYRYLWKQGRFGRQPNHADKRRPALVLHREPVGPGLYAIWVLAITTQKQREPDKGLAIPLSEREAVGLKAKSWVVTTGMNKGSWPSDLFEPFYPPDTARAQQAHARFSATFFSRIAVTVAANMQAAVSDPHPHKSYR